MNGLCFKIKHVPLKFKHIPISLLKEIESNNDSIDLLKMPTFKPKEQETEFMAKLHVALKLRGDTMSHPQH